MTHSKTATGVVVLMDSAKLVLLTSEVSRNEAARLIRETKKIHRPLKFFGVPASRAASAIKKINESGLIGKLAILLERDFAFSEKILHQLPSRRNSPPLSPPLSRGRPRLSAF